MGALDRFGRLPGRWPRERPEALRPSRRRRPDEGTGRDPGVADDGQAPCRRRTGNGKDGDLPAEARRLARGGEEYRFLVWNHLLHRAGRALFEGELQAETWNSWFWKVFRDTFGRPPPLQPSKKSWKPTDWKAVAQAVVEFPESAGQGRRPFLVIDEGQDMPPGFYDFLLQLGFENLLVVADQNQQIKEDENTSRRELEELLGGNARELNYNHRNSRPVARLAREFATDDPASPLPQLPAGSTFKYEINEMCVCIKHLYTEIFIAALNCIMQGYNNAQARASYS